MRSRSSAVRTPTQKQRQVWDRSAPGYDRQIAFAERFWFTGGREWLARRACGRVLEVAVGTGRSLEFYDPAVTLTAVELSAAMFDRARTRAKELQLDVQLLEGDAEALPVADESFDTVVCALSLCSIPDPPRAIAEMRRVLVPGGQLLLLDHVVSTRFAVRAVQRVVEQATTRLAGEHFTRRQLPLVLAAGLQVVEAERLKAGTVERLRAIRPGGT